MKNITKIFAIALVALGFSATTFAQGVTTTNPTSASAKILTAMSLTQGATQLNFGTMAVPTAATTVSIAANGGRSSGGNITLLTQAPIAAAAAYTVGGDASAPYTITLPSSITISNGTPAQDMTVNGFVCSYAGLTSTLSAGGADAFTVGATLNLANGQAPGSYSGSFNVSVAYN